jgi:hypothetical protein
LLALDLSKPEDCIATLHSWLHKISAFSIKYHNSLSKDVSKALKKSIWTYLKNARSARRRHNQHGEVGNEDNGKNTSELQDEDEAELEGNFATSCFGLPVIIVGCKADAIQMESAAVIKHSRDIHGRLRSICMEVGAALVYTAAATCAGAAVPSSSSAGTSTAVAAASAAEGVAAPSTTGNCAELKAYIMHRLFPDQIPLDQSLDVRREYSVLVYASVLFA